MGYEIQPNYEAEKEIEIRHNKIPQRKTHGCLISIIILAIIAIVLWGVFIFAKKDATNSDIIINDSQQNLTSYMFIFTPNKDIENLQFEIAFYDNNKNYKSSIKKNIGNVEKGQKYTVKISINDLSINQAFSDYISINVAGGKVPLFSF